MVLAVNGIVLAVDVIAEVANMVVAIYIMVQYVVVDLANEVVAVVKL